MVSSIWLFQYLAIMNYIMNKTAIMNNRNATLVYEFWVIQIFFLWGKCLRVRLLAFMMIAYLHLERNSNCFPVSSYHFVFPPSVQE